MRPAHLAGVGIDDRHSRTGVVDEQLLAGTMQLSHRSPLHTGIGVVVRAELGVLVGRQAGMALAVLLPQQLQGHALAAQLAMHPRQIDAGPLTTLARRRRAQPRRKLGLVQRRHARPVEAGNPGPGHVLADHALGQTQGTANALVREPAVELETKQFLDVAHGHSRCRHRSPKGRGGWRPLETCTTNPRGRFAKV